MAGRPKKEDSRDKQYRVRLNEEEDRMLGYASQATGVRRSEIFRIALQDYYNNVRLNQLNMADEEADWELDGISLTRVVDCPYCGAQNKIDVEDESEVTSYERQMGGETLYEFDYEVHCTSCEGAFRVQGYISEYPIGALNHEEINVVPIEEVDE